MKGFHRIRIQQKLSQRQLAVLSSVSYKTVQLLEQGSDARISTWEQVSGGLGYASHVIQKNLERIFENSPQSLIATSERMVGLKKTDWTIELFEFVDNFRKSPNYKDVERAPVANLDVELVSLLASTVETLCDESHLPYPNWVFGIFALPEPWFVAEVENLKAMALVESPIHFRKRNIFVLDNFLARF